MEFSEGPRTCIYCLESKSVDSFDRDHVLPRFLGTFDDGLPRLDCVCKRCNGYFGREVEQVHALDSIEARLLAKHGLISDIQEAFWRRSSFREKVSREQHQPGHSEDSIEERRHHLRICERILSIEPWVTGLGHVRPGIVPVLRDPGSAASRGSHAARRPPDAGRLPSSPVVILPSPSATDGWVTGLEPVAS